MSKTKFIKSISELTKETAERIKDGKIVAKSNDPKVQKAIDKKVDDLTGMKTLPSGKKIKKRMTAKERKEMSKPFNKMLSDAQKSKKGRTDKQFDAAVKKDMAKLARVEKVKKENMAAAKKPKKFSGGGMAVKGLGRAFIKSKR
jgi:adenine-specific DNA methylase